MPDLLENLLGGAGAAAGLALAAKGYEDVGEIGTASEHCQLHLHT